MAALADTSDGNPPRSRNADDAETICDSLTAAIRESYDRLAEEYAHRFVNELQGKPPDRELQRRFSRGVAYLGEACDMGCGPGHIARYLRDAGTDTFGLAVARSGFDPPLP